MALKEIAVTHVRVICDGQGVLCQHTLPFVVRNTHWEEVAAELRKQGWGVVGNSVVCPGCKKEGS